MNTSEIKQKRYIKKLIIFLVGKGLLLNFCANYDKYSIYNAINKSKMPLKMFLMSEHPKSFFLNSFVWSYTPERRDLWENLSEEWGDIIDKGN